MSLMTTPIKDAFANVSWKHLDDKSQIQSETKFNKDGDAYRFLRVYTLNIGQVDLNNMPSFKNKDTQVTFLRPDSAKGGKLSIAVNRANVFGGGNTFPSYTVIDEDTTLDGIWNEIQQKPGAPTSSTHLDQLTYAKQLTGIALDFKTETNEESYLFSIDLDAKSGRHLFFSGDKCEAYAIKIVNEDSNVSKVVFSILQKIDLASARAIAEEAMHKGRHPRAMSMMELDELKNPPAREKGCCSYVECACCVGQTALACFFFANACPEQFDQLLDYTMTAFPQLPSSAQMK